MRGAGAATAVPSGCVGAVLGAWGFPTLTFGGGGRVETTFKALSGIEGGGKGLGGHAEVHEIAEAPAVALSILVLSATGFTEICNGGEFCVEGTTWDIRK